VKASELRELSTAELIEKGRELREAHLNAAVRHATGQLEDTAKLRSLRRDIARVETILRERSGAES